MLETDTLQRFIFEQLPIRGTIVRLKQSYQTILCQHQYPSSVSEYLGQVLLAAVLLRHTIKGAGQLILQLTSQLPCDEHTTINLLSAKCNQALEISAVAQFSQDSKTDDATASLVTTFIPDNSTQPHQSIIPIDNKQSIVASLESYFLQSEQLPTKFWLYADQDKAIGLLIQQMPGQSASAQNEFNLAMDQLRKDALEKDIINFGNKELAHKLFPEQDLRFFDLESIIFKCSCTTERFENALKLAGKEEAENILKTNKTIEVKCEFCSKTYNFSKDDIDNIFNQPTTH